MLVIMKNKIAKGKFGCFVHKIPHIYFTRIANLSFGAWKHERIWHRNEMNDYLRMMGNHTKSIFLLPTEENEIRKIASELLTKSSSGYDNISNVLLKEIIEDIVEPLSFILNHSMQSGEFPDSMKLAEVIPLYKSKEHYLECNYRPISLLTTISKILEKIVYT